MDRRLPSWISLNDNLSFKSSKPSSPRRINDEEALFPRTRNRSGSLGSLKQKSPPTSPQKNLSNGENRLSNNDFIEMSVNVHMENDQNVTFVQRMIKSCKNPNAGGYLPDWNLVQQFIANATDEQLAPLIITSGSLPDHHTFTSTKDDNIPLYQPTVLGQLCRFNMNVSKNETSIIVATIHEALIRCRQQLYCSQVHSGHTPLRDAVCNPTLLPEVLEVLMSQDAFSPRNNYWPIALLPDTLNLNPFDHLVQLVQMDDYNGSALCCIQILLKYTPPTSASRASTDLLLINSNLINDNESYNTISEAHTFYGASHESASSPLIRILSLGTSFGSSFFAGSAYSSPRSSPTSKTGPVVEKRSPRSDQNLSFDQSEARFVKTESTESQRISKDRLLRILLTVKMLLDWDPLLLHKNSCSTDCTPLHIAIRNYGNYYPLIRELIDRDMANDRNLSQLKYRNKFGDLPLHVACSVGVPIDVLKLLLQKTTAVNNISSYATSGSILNQKPTMTSLTPDSLVWSYNSSGYTPIDLEWIRHIEVGCSFHSHRPFHPIDSRGVSQQQRNQASKGTGSRSDDMYYNLLRQAVDQVMKNQNTNTGPSNSQKKGRSRLSDIPIERNAFVNLQPKTQNMVEMNNKSVGLLLQRIFLIICASFPDLESQERDDSSSVVDTQHILHKVCALSSPHNGPTLPLPLQELVMWNYPEQLEVKEPLQNKLPLHMALSCNRWNEPHGFGASRVWTYNYRLQKASDEWKVWIRKLIERAPIACSSFDKNSRLPIHYALDWDFSEQAIEWMEDVLSTSEIDEMFAINDSVRDLIAEYPHALETIDPVTKLFPFQTAAANPLISLNTVYYLLRCWPAGVTS